MKSESIKFTVGKFTGGKLLLALVGLMLLGVVSTQAKANHQSPGHHAYTFTIGTAIGNNVGLTELTAFTGGQITATSFNLATAETKTDFSVLEDAGITFTRTSGLLSGTPTAAVDITYTLNGYFESSLVSTDFDLSVYVAPPAVQALSAAAQDPLTFTAGVESTFTLTQGMGGTPPYNYYVTDPGYTDVRTAAFGFNQATGVFFSKTGVATTDAGSYIVEIRDGASGEVVKPFEIVVLAAAEPVVNTGETLVLTQGDITFTAGVETTHTLNAATGGITPYEEYTLSKVVGSTRVPIRAAALVFDGTVASRELRSTTSIVASDAGTYRITVFANDSSEATDTFEIVVSAPPAISFVNTPTTQVADGQVFAAYVGQTNVDVTLPDTDPKSGTAAGTVSGITQLMYMNGCRVTGGSRPDMRAFGTTGDPATTCAHTAFSSSASLWRFNGHHNDDVGTMDIAPLSGADVVQANWASGLKAVAFSYEVTYSGDVITRNFTYVFYNKPTIAAQTNVSWNGDATAFVATFSPGADGYRGGTFNGVFTIDGGALTYGVALAQSGLNPAFTGGLVPGIGVDVIDINGVATPVLTATAYTAATPAYVAATYELTVGDLAGNTAVTSFTLAVTERVQAPTAPVFSATKFEYIFISGDDGARGNIGIAGTLAEQVAAGLVYETSPALPAGLTISTSDDTRGAYLANTMSSTNMGWATYTLTATASNSGGSATSAGVPLIFKVVSQPSFAGGNNPSLTFYQSPATTITMPKLNVDAADLPFTRYAFHGSQSSLTTCGLKNVPVGSGRSSTPDIVISSDANTMLSADCTYDTHTLSGYYNTEAGFKRGQVRGIAFVVLAEAPRPTFGTQQGDVTYTAGHASAKTLVEAGGAGNFTYTLARVDGNALSALVFDGNAASRELRSTAAIAAADAGRYELTASDGTDSDTSIFSVVVASAPTFPDALTSQRFADGDTVAITFSNASGGAFDTTTPLQYELSAGGAAISSGDDISATTGLTYTAAAGTTPATISGTVASGASADGGVLFDLTITYIAEDANGAMATFQFTFNPATPAIVPTLVQEDLVFFTDATLLTYSLNEATSEDENADFEYTLTGPDGAEVPSEVAVGVTTTLFVFDPATRELRNTTFATATYSANYTFSVVDTIDSRATASSRFNISVIERPVTTDETYAAVEAEFLPDVGAAVAAETVLAIGERVGQVRARGFGAPYVSIGEQSTLSGFISQHAKPLVDKQIEPKQLLKGAHLSLPLFSNGAFSWIPPMGIWLAIEGRAMSNETDEVKWDGTLGGAYLGIDARVGDSIVGVASATSKSTIDYEDLNPAVGADAIKGEYDLSLSSINPYISWQNGNSDWWITLGEGEGELTRNPDKVDEIKTDLVLKSVAFGVSRALNQQERRKTRLSASLQAARLEVEGKAGKNLLDPGFVAETYKGGLGKVAAEVDLSRTLRGGSTLSPFYQAAALYDYGDNDNGVGMETVGGIRWLSTKRGSGGEMQVRWAAAGDYEEWGAYAQWRLQSGADGQGVSASLRPGYGDSDSADILQNGLPTSLIDGADYELHLDARVGFGLTGARGLVTPFAEWLHREDEVYRLGVDWLPSKLFEANLTGEQYTDEKRVWLKGEVKF